MQYDVNGNKGPGKSGYDVFVFTICANSKPAFSSYCKDSISTREQALQKCNTDGRYCTTLLQFDDWKIKDDYPIKL